MRNRNEKESFSEKNILIPKETSVKYNHPQFKINKKIFEEKMATIQNYSVGLTENVLISRMVSFLDPKLPLSNKEIRKYLIYCFKIYHELSSIPIQKFTLLPPNERPLAIENLKGVFIRAFSEIIESKEGTPTDYLLFIFEDYFKMYE
ncbi:hypothetical protein DSAG12_03109 [Promethearchaeum syntrophicum]|uniref:Uncharacterized protein n=1 Tax=Promethearchaeum syntrophicum TaxID=2594042 RepID=A0A5B9DEK6_9ARCH|nr:hypothetical protein [Candidatus Prometheoarchaeum syntrophicum]QEE17277.1 hypothetical protein DSAG12_03109 [Candidatus Prometheoarchaeum syntrophicum]